MTAFLLSAVGLAGSAYYQLVQNADAMQTLFGGVPAYITATVAVVRRLIARIIAGAREPEAVV